VKPLARFRLRASQRAEKPQPLWKAQRLGYKWPSAFQERVGILAGGSRGQSLPHAIA